MPAEELKPSTSGSTIQQEQVAALPLRNGFRYALHTQAEIPG